MEAEADRLKGGSWFSMKFPIEVFNEPKCG